MSRKPNSAIRTRGARTRKEILNQEFYEACKAFVASALAFLRSCIEKDNSLYSFPSLENKTKSGEKSESRAGGLPYRFRTPMLKLTIGTKSLPLPSMELYVDPRKKVEADPRVQFMYKHSENLKGLTEFSACLEAMRRDPKLIGYIDQPVGTCDTRVGYKAESYLLRLVRKQIVGDSGSITFKPELFDETYTELERFFYSDFVNYRVFVPLHNFQSDIDEADVGSNIVIRRITDKELDELHHNSSLYWDSPYPTHVVEIPMTTEKFFGDQMTVRPAGFEKSKFDRFLTGMRLFKSGVVGFNIMRVIHEEDEFINVAIPIDDLKYKLFRGPPYNLAPEEVNDFRRFWLQFNKANLEKRYRLRDSVRLFLEGYDQEKPGDKLTKYMSALEAIFLGGRKTKGIGPRVARKASQFLGESTEERVRLKEWVLDLYEKRSVVIHVGRRQPPTEEDANQAEEMLRKSIKKFLSELERSPYYQIASRIDRLF